MKRIITLLFLFCCLSSYAATNTVQFNLGDLLSTAQTLQRKTVQIIPESTPRTNTNNVVIVSERRFFNTGTNGSFIATNVVFGNYMVEVWGQTYTSRFRILVPDVASNFYASDLITTSNSVPGESAGYTQAQANNRFVLKLSGWASNLTVTNLVMPVGAVDGYVWTVTNANGRGEWRPPAGGGSLAAKTNGVSVTGAATTLDFIEGTNVVIRATNTAGVVTLQINAASGVGGGSLTTNANQFGASTQLTIKDRPLLTNAVNRDFLSITGSLAALEMHTGNASERWLLDPVTGAFNFFGPSAYLGLAGVPYFIYNGSSATVPTNFTTGGTNQARWVKLTGVTNDRVAIVTGDTNLSSHPDVSVAELSFLDGVSSSIQSQINARQFGSAVLSNFVATVADNVTNINEGNRLYVRTNGNNSTAQRGRMDKAYLTLTAAKDAAIHGDLINVGPGLYSSNNTNLLKAGVSWFFESGAVVSNRVQQAADDFWVGIFDDRFSGAVTSSIVGQGTFIWDATDHDFGGVDIRALGMLVMTNSGSLISFQGKRAEFFNRDGPSLPAIFHIVNGRKFFVDLDEMEAPEYNSQDPDTVNAMCLYWERCDVYGRIGKIKTEGYGVWANTSTDNKGVTNDLYLTGDRWQTAGSAAIYTSMSNTTHRAWFNVKELETDTGQYGTVTIYDGGKTYIDALIISGINNVAIRGDIGIANVSGNEAWITTQKIKSDRGWLYNNKAKLFLSAQHYEDTASGSGVASDKFFELSGGYSTIIGGNAKAYASGIWQAGGTNVIDGLRMDSSAVANVTNVPLTYKGGLLTVKDVTLTATNNAANAVNAVAAQTLTVEGYLNANKIIDSDVTIAGASTNTIAVLHLPNLSTNGFLQVGPGGIIRTGAIGASLSIGADGTLGVSETNKFNRSQFHAWGGTNVQWRMVKNITLTNVVDVSAAAYYPSNGTFFTIHNNANGRITEWTLDGIFIRKIDGTGSQVPDAEAIVYLGGNKFAVSDEDNNRIFILGITNNASGSTWDTNNTTIIQVHTSVGNDPGSGSGVEGLSYDWDRLGWWIAREKTPAQLLFLSTDGQTTNNFFTTAQMQAFTNANHTDFSDIFLDRENQILFVTQDEPNQFDRVLGISLVTSNVLISLNLTNFGQLEGVSMTPDGKLLLAGEANQFAIFEPVLGGLNSGQSWELNSQTNLPSVPRYPFGVSVGDAGAWLTNVLTATAALDFPSTVAQSFTNLSIAVTGAADGDAVTLGIPNAALMAGTCYTATASNNIVWIRHNNYSATSKDPASGTFRVVVDKFR